MGNIVVTNYEKIQSAILQLLNPLGKLRAHFLSFANIHVCVTPYCPRSILQVELSGGTEYILILMDE